MPKISGRYDSLEAMPLFLRLLFYIEVAISFSVSFYIPIMNYKIFFDFSNPFINITIIGVSGVIIFALAMLYFQTETKREERITQLLNENKNTQSC